MELRVLRYFLAVAEEGSFTAASAILHITQPTLSRQIQDLEDRLGKPLLIRNGSGVSLTPEGHFLRQRAEEMLTMAEQTEQALRDSTHRLEGWIALGVGEFPAVRPVAEYLRALQARHPGIRYNVHTATASILRQRLDEGALDFAVVLDTGNLADANVEAQPLPMRSRWCAMLRKDHPLAAKRVLTPNDLKGVPLIAAPKAVHPEQRGSVFRAWFGNASAMRIAAVSDLSYTTRMLAAAGLGVALTLDRPHGDAEFPELTTRPLEPEITVGYALIWKRARPFSPAAAALLKILRESTSPASDPPAQNNA